MGDDLVTRLHEAARTMDIEILDYLILAGNSYYSFVNAKSVN